MELLAGWSVRHLADGMTLEHPSGRGAGLVRVRERQRPLRGLRALIDEALAEMALEAPVVGRAERILTEEGEYAAIVTIEGRRGDSAVERTIGLVLADDSYTRIDGFAAAPAEARGVVRHLVERSSLGLGAQRRRPYLYTPPPGWAAMPRGPLTEWHAPGFPRAHGVISVLPARPHGGGAAVELACAMQEASRHGFVPEQVAGSVSIESAWGLAGELHRLVGRSGDEPRLVEVAAFADPRFLYLLRHETDGAGAGAHRAAFAALLLSVRPLPVATPEARRPVDAVTC